MSDGTIVVNVKHNTENYVYIGRPSKWGNPFRIGPDGTREEVIAKYREHARSRFSNQELAWLYGRYLGCYCKPLPCHGDVLAELAYEAAIKLRDQRNQT